MLGQGIFLGLNIHQIFHLLNKNITKNPIDLSFNQINNFEKLYAKK